MLIIDSFVPAEYQVCINESWYKSSMVFLPGIGRAACTMEWGDWWVAAEMCGVHGEKYEEV